MPLHCADGYEIGTLCVIDRRSRRIDEQQMRRLRALGGVVTDMLTMRLSARRALAQAEMTSHEVDHRAMNSLQFVASLLQLQSRAAVLPETAQQLRAAANRVLAVARVHRTFTTIGKTDRVPILDHLRTLCAELSSSLGSEIRLESHDEVEVSKAQVLSIGLIVNELVTNARKHAGDPISVVFRRIDPTQHELCVLDSGPGLPTGFVPTDSAVNGLGMKVVNALAAQLAGTLTATNHPTGHGARLTVTSRSPDDTRCRSTRRHRGALPASLVQLAATPPGQRAKPAPSSVGRVAVAGDGRAAFVPALARVHDLHHREHDGYLDQHADHGGKCGAGREAEQADGGGDREFEEVAGADQRRGAATQCCSPAARFSR